MSGVSSFPRLEVLFVLLLFVLLLFVLLPFLLLFLLFLLRGQFLRLFEKDRRK